LEASPRAPGELLRKGDTPAMGSIPPLLLQVIESTLARAQRSDVDAALASRNATPREVAPDDVLRQRRDFLGDQLGGELSRSELQETFERIINGNELQDINYLEKGTIASHSVCRLRFNAMGGTGYATGFLISPRVLITNNHVFPDAETARTAEAQFRYERGVDGRDLTPVKFKLEPDRLFFTSKKLDFSVVAVDARDVTGATPLEVFKFLPLIDVTGKVAEGEWLTIVQHPAGQMKQVCVRENQLLRRMDDFLWYSTDTLAGSSGSPVFSNDWFVVALHHSGVPEERNGVIQTVLGRDFNPKVDKEDDIKWKANEGVRVSRIVQTLREALPNHDLIKPIIAPQPIPSAGVVDTKPQPVISAGAVNAKPQEMAMGRSVTVQLEITDAGEVRLVGGGAVEAFATEASKPKGTRDERGNVIDAPADRTFKGAHLKGYDPKLGDYTVLLPKLDASLEEKAAPLLANKNQFELKYEHFSVVMNKERRLAFFSAANVSAEGRFKLTGRIDDWLVDPRIDRDHQIDNTYYLRNKLDRGHLTRREDMEYGNKVKEAVRSANGTCVFANCVPQRDIFNQGKAKGIGDDSRLWAGLEDYILEHINPDDELLLQVFTGPIFSASDPKYRGNKIPLEFWKVAVGIAADGELFATAYLLSQENLIDVTDLDEAARELPLGAYLTYQRRVTEIENATGLHFFFTRKSNTKQFPLSQVDPLESPAGRRPRRRGAGTDEAFAPAGSGALTSFNEIVLP
jgi:endonuclease G